MTYNPNTPVMWQLVEIRTPEIDQLMGSKYESCWYRAAHLACKRLDRLPVAHDFQIDEVLAILVNAYFYFVDMPLDVRAALQWLRPRIGPVARGRLIGRLTALRGNELQRATFGYCIESIDQAFAWLSDQELEVGGEV